MLCLSLAYSLQCNRQPLVLFETELKGLNSDHKHTTAYYIFSLKITSKQVKKVANIVLVAGGIILFIFTGVIAALGLTLLGLNNLFA